MEEIKGENLSINLQNGTIEFKPETRRKIKYTESGIEISPSTN